MATVGRPSAAARCDSPVSTTDDHARAAEGRGDRIERRAGRDERVLHLRGQCARALALFLGAPEEHAQQSARRQGPLDLDPAVDRPELGRAAGVGQQHGVRRVHGDGRLRCAAAGRSGPAPGLHIPAPARRARGSGRRRAACAGCRSASDRTGTPGARGRRRTRTRRPGRWPSARPTRSSAGPARRAPGRSAPRATRRFRRAISLRLADASGACRHRLNATRCTVDTWRLMAGIAAKPSSTSQSSVACGNARAMSAARGSAWMTSPMDDVLTIRRRTGRDCALGSVRPGPDSGTVSDRRSSIDGRSSPQCRYPSGLRCCQRQPSAHARSIESSACQPSSRFASEASA